MHEWVCLVRLAAWKHLSLFEKFSIIGTSPLSTKTYLKCLAIHEKYLLSGFHNLCFLYKKLRTATVIWPHWLWGIHKYEFLASLPECPLLGVGLPCLILVQYCWAILAGYLVIVLLVMPFSVPLTHQLLFFISFHSPFLSLLHCQASVSIVLWSTNNKDLSEANTNRPQAAPTSSLISVS